MVFHSHRPYPWPVRWRHAPFIVWFCLMLAPFLIMVCAPVPAVGMERPTHQGAAQSSSHNSDLSPHSSDHPFGPQRTLFEHNHLWGYRDQHGRVVIPAQFPMAEDFSKQGLSAVCMECRKVPMGEHYVMEGGAWGLINRTGRIVLPIEHPSPDAAIFSYKLIRK